jgi:hypothetical protein
VTHRLAQWLPALLTVALLACEQPAEAPSSDDQLKRQLEQRARAQPPRATMSVGYIRVLEGIEAGGPALVSSETGADIEIEAAHLVVSAIEAHLCEAQTSLDGTEEGWLRPLERLIVGTAHAHVPSSATRLGTPFVEDLFAPGRARIVGEIAPPLGRYCRLYAIVSPADDDVLNLGELEPDEIEGNTLLLRGRWRPEADAPWRAFESASSARAAVELRAVDPNTGQHPLVLGDPAQTQMILLDKTVSPALFDGIEGADLDGSTAADEVLSRLQDELHIRVFDKE